MPNGKLIAVNGPPGCGKTTLAVKLAQEVHERTKKKVIYLSPDTLIPSIGLIFPRREKESLLSLGKALESVELAITDILGVCLTTKAMPNLGYVGYIPGEGAHSYAELQENKVMLMFDILRDNFDYIFVDCDRDREDMISSIASGLSDHLIQIINPDIKSVAYYGFEAIPDRAIQVLILLDNDAYLPIQDIKAKFEDIQFTILYSRPVKQQMREGELMDLLNDPVYRKSVRPIVDILVREPEPEPEQDDEEQQPDDETTQENADPLMADGSDAFWS